MPPARLLVDPPLAGPSNMARDEALLAVCADGPAIPTFRFYRWAPPTISLGYFQEYAEYAALDPPAGELPVVRRATGGGAILHDLEVTYSIVIPISHERTRHQPNELYRLAHEAILRAVGPRARIFGAGRGACGAAAQRGPFFCFARRHELDIVVDDPAAAGGCAKLAGSAQRRTRTAILQHGSIILASRYPQQPAAAWAELGGPADFDASVARLVGAFEASFGFALRESSWRPAELEVAEALAVRYAESAWTQLRRREWGPAGPTAR